MPVLTFGHNDEGLPFGASDDGPKSEWEFRSAKCVNADRWVIVGYHRPVDSFTRYVWPTGEDGEAYAIPRVPTLEEMKAFANECMSGRAKGTVLSRSTTDIMLIGANT